MPAEHHFSTCAIRAIRDYYPRHKVGSPQWVAEQKILSAELIRCHYEAMDTKTKRRALATIAVLES